MLRLMGVSAPSLHRESTDSLVKWQFIQVWSHIMVCVIPEATCILCGILCVWYLSSLSL